MKEYKRKKEKPEVTNPKLRKRDTCRGGKPHDWVLTLPYGYEHIEGLYVDAEPVYKAYGALDAMYKTLHEELEKVGIKKTKSWGINYYSRTKEYCCAICGKKKHDFDL